jgi:hypothetical protein
VIEFISSGQLDCKRQGVDADFEKQSFSQPALLKLLMRPRGKKEMHEATNSHAVEKVDDIRRDSEDFLELPSKRTALSGAVDETQSSLAAGIRIPSTKDSIEKNIDSAKPGFEEELGIDEYLPESFKYELMTPRILSSMSSSSTRSESTSSSGIFSRDAAEDTGGVDMEGHMQIVCDVGTQTDWSILDEAGY